MSSLQFYSIFPKQFFFERGIALLTACADNLSCLFLIIFCFELKTQRQREAHHLVISKAEAMMISFIVLYINKKMTMKLKTVKLYRNTPEAARVHRPLWCIAKMSLLSCVSGDIIKLVLSINPLDYCL